MRQSAPLSHRNEICSYAFKVQKMLKPYGCMLHIAALRLFGEHVSGKICTLKDVLQIHVSKFPFAVQYGVLSTRRS